MLMCVQEKLSYEDPDRKLYHLCIVNLVIGTLYCAKGNYEFGIGRIMKSLEPYQRKVCVCVCVLGAAVGPVCMSLVTVSLAVVTTTIVSMLLFLLLVVTLVTRHSLGLTHGTMPSAACCPC